MQPGPDSIGIIAISHGCAGVAARACGLVGMEPAKVSSLLLLYYISFSLLILRNSKSIPDCRWAVSTQVAEILKDRPLWLRDCRSMEVVNVLPAGTNGTIELLYMQVKTALLTVLRPGRLS